MQDDRLFFLLLDGLLPEEGVPGSKLRHRIRPRGSMSLILLHPLSGVAGTAGTSFVRASAFFVVVVVFGVSAVGSAPKTVVFSVAVTKHRPQAPLTHVR